CATMAARSVSRPSAGARTWLQPIAASARTVKGRAPTMGDAARLPPVMGGVCSKPLVCVRGTGALHGSEEREGEPGVPDQGERGGIPAIEREAGPSQAEGGLRRIRRVAAPVRVDRERPLESGQSITWPAELELTLADAHERRNLVGVALLDLLVQRHRGGLAI